ncbi:MAG: helix-turn-helix transcriptional regulator [Victivallales bacterium]|nr:helix-turn-helix transcriptional regulator [Victivallales bacterium]
MLAKCIIFCKISEKLSFFAGMANDEQNIVAQQLRYFRKKLGLKQSEMAQRLGVSVSLYSKLESGQIDTTSRRLEQFAARLQTSVEFLTTGQGPEHVDNYTTAPGSEELSRLSLDALERLVGLAQDPKLTTLAEQVAPTLRVTSQRALAVVIRTILLGGQT